jgi:hypothetical protein
MVKKMRKKIFGFDLKKQWDYENGFYLTSHITRIAKMLAHYELYKSIIDLPGHIVECGVFKGASLIRFATFRELYENPFSRKIIGFDAFGKFPEYEDIDDKKFIEKFVEEAGDGIPIVELKEILSNKAFTNYELVQGDILKTIPKYISDHHELKIALLHIDVDVYHPTLVILQNLYDKVVKNGLIIFDDFGTVAGETKAIDEFFKDKNVAIEKLAISHVPSFIRKK